MACVCIMLGERVYWGMHVLGDTSSLDFNNHWWCFFFQAIHEKIKSLDLNQCHAKIKQVDSHSTLGNGIVIQVSYIAKCTCIWCKIHNGLSLSPFSPLSG